jgi:hypothetical protein
VPPRRRGKNVMLLLHPGQLGFQIAYPPPEPAHVREQARIWSADVSEQRLRHGRPLFRCRPGSGATSRRVRGLIGRSA